MNKIWLIGIKQEESFLDQAVVIAPDRITAEILFDRMRNTKDEVLSTVEIGVARTGLPVGVVSMTGQRGNVR